MPTTRKVKPTTSNASSIIQLCGLGSKFHTEEQTLQPGFRLRAALHQPFHPCASYLTRLPQWGEGQLYITIPGPAVSFSRSGSPGGNEHQESRNNTVLKIFSQSGFEGLRTRTQLNKHLLTVRTALRTPGTSSRIAALRLATRRMPGCAATLPVWDRIAEPRPRNNFG
jgi:hypothetical protein